MLPSLLGISEVFRGINRWSLLVVFENTDLTHANIFPDISIIAIFGNFPGVG